MDFVAAYQKDMHISWPITVRVSYMEYSGGHSPEVEVHCKMGETYLQNLNRSILEHIDSHLDLDRKIQRWSLSDVPPVSWQRIESYLMECGFTSEIHLGRWASMKKRLNSERDVRDLFDAEDEDFFEHLKRIAEL